MRADNYALSEDTKRLARQRAGADLRLRVHRGDRGCSRSTATRSSASRPSCWSARRSTESRSSGCCSTCRPLELRHGRRRGPDAAARHRPTSRLGRSRSSRRASAGASSSSASAAISACLASTAALASRMACASAARCVGRQRAGLGGVERLRAVGGERVLELRLELLQLQLQLLSLGELLALLEAVARELLALLSLLHPVEESHSGPPFVVVPRHCRILDAIAAAYHDQP